nr:GAF and ANTAR domain-containing protein [Rhodococcus sp. 06-621-2]
MNTSGEHHTGERFASLAWDLAQAEGSAPTAQRIVDLAVKTIHCSGAAVTTLRLNGTLKIVAASDPEVLAAAASIADRTGQSATKATLAAKVTTVNNDVANDPRWDQYRRLITADTPIRSTAGFYLTLAGVELGVMSFYSHRPRFFTPAVLDDCAIFADHAAVALKAARAEDRSTQLAEAVASNREIGIAIGILMSRYTVTEGAAFDMLVVASSHTNRKLRDVAAVNRLGFDAASFFVKDEAHVEALPARAT